MLRRRRLSVGRGATGWTGKVALQATCMCAFAVSTQRNDPSIAVRRSSMVRSMGPAPAAVIGPVSKIPRPARQVVER
jgi:hypothetical protein